MPLSRGPAARIVDAVAPSLEVRLEEGVTPELLRRVAGHELAAAAVLEVPAAQRQGVRIDPLRDEPLLAALPADHRYAGAEAIPLGAFTQECVLLPRDQLGGAFNAWLRAVVRAAGFALDRTLQTMSAPWDRRMLPVAEGEAVSAVVAEWVREPIAGVATVPFDPPLSLPIDFASGESAAPLLDAALRLRDAEGWLTGRRRIESPPV